MINSYLDKINQRYKLGNATEHTFRGDLQQLLESMIPGIAATNEPKRQACGAPDYVITRKEVPIGYIEAKDIGTDLTGKNIKEQLDRYREALDNLIVTDYLDFRLYHNGDFVASVRIAEVDGNKIVPLPENFDRFTSLINDFGRKITQSIKSSKKLAEMMADKAKLLAYVIHNALESDEQSQENSTLKDQMKAFRSILIHDIDSKAFADIYAQTIAYGMFAARLHDPTLETFTRQEAAENIPKTNPFLRKLFQYIAGYDLDDRIKWIVDALADIFRAADVAAILKNFGKATQTHDPIMHFYETFLAEYDPKLRKSRGVFYTPEPVVNFIVRAVDDILKTEFGLPDGLADTTKTKIKVDVQGKKVEKEVHKVQILDPATGTGTFLAEVIRHIHNGFEGQQGIWSHYVENELIPRLNGFEILMASYAMAHLKLDLLLSETGYKPSNGKRFQVYLTNALEEHHPDTGTLFASWLSAEANEANHIKRDTPVMVVIGNPPYSGHSSNKSEWLDKLLEDYKTEPTGGKLKERNPKWLNDDYVKFVRFGQHFIEKNQEGILAFITNNGYLDNPTFRGMRYQLLQAFDLVYSIDLHGSAKKQEKAIDGSDDKNVFDIQQGVAIMICLRFKARPKQTLVKSADLLGMREYKYDVLSKNSLSSMEFSQFVPRAPDYLFKEINESVERAYRSGFSVVEAFQTNVMGFQTHRDHFCIDADRQELIKRLSKFAQSDMHLSELEAAFQIKATSDFDIAKAQAVLRQQDWLGEISTCSYRPFDNQYVFFDRSVVDRPRRELLQHVKGRENTVLGVGRQGLAVGDIEWCLATVSRNPVDANMFRRGGVNLFPLYLYSDDSQPALDEKGARTPNLNRDIVSEFADKISLEFVSEPPAGAGGPPEGGTRNAFAPIDILDYMYAVLHSPAYRERYKEFLKIDFPRVPYPKDRETFWKLVELGGELRQIHLLESPKVNQFITGYPEGGDNVVVKPEYKPDPVNAAGRVYINSIQYFSDIPETAWNFYIGGYQPAQKWLKDRKGRTLAFEDIRHYQKIIVALTETDKIMKSIDQIDFI